MRAGLLILLLASGCKRDAAPPGTLFSQVKQTLADRDARLTSYHLAGETTEGAEHARHEFFFRSPNKMRAALRGPLQLEWSFDGARVYGLAGPSKTFTTYELKLPPDQAAALLHSKFSPFVLEGFRTPLMPMKAVTATLRPHPRGPQAVELKVEPGDGVTVTYVLRWPGADFLERRGEADAGTSELKVEAEQCDEKLKLCVPTLAAEYFDGKRLLTIRLTTVELNVDIGAEEFTPQVPAGWTTEVKRVVEEQ